MTRAWGHVVETVSNALRPFLSVGSTVETSIAIASSHSLSVCVCGVWCVVRVDGQSQNPFFCPFCLLKLTILSMSQQGFK